jgi:hypothetical protein
MASWISRRTKGGRRNKDDLDEGGNTIRSGGGCTRGEGCWSDRGTRAGESGSSREGTSGSARGGCEKKGWGGLRFVPSSSKLIFTNADNAWLADTPAKKTPHDFRLFFPHLLDSGAELWTSSKFLSHSSPYFETLLSSSFSEATSRRSKRARTETSSVEAPRAPTTEERDYDGDSDDETDTFLCSRIPPILDDASAADDLPYCEIRITQTAYSTYRAVLLFLQTGHISFTPLSSSLSTSRDDYLASKLEESPNLPLPVSPKSVFRLADLLDLPSLEALALTSFKSSLTVDGAAHELFSDASVLYRELRTAVLQFVKEKADEVKATAGWEDVMRKVEQDEVKGSAPILLELLRMGVALWGGSFASEGNRFLVVVVHFCPSAAIERCRSRWWTSSRLHRCSLSSPEEAKRCRLEDKKNEKPLFSLLVSSSPAAASQRRQHR